MNNEERLDPINVGFIVISIGVVASFGWPTAISLAVIYYVQQYLRKTPAAQEWKDRILTSAPKLLPAPKETKALPMSTDTRLVRTANTSIKVPEVRAVDPYAHLPFWERVTKTYDSSTAIDRIGAIDMPGKKKNAIISAEDRQYGFLQYALKRLPPYVHYTQVGDPPSRLAVPIGFDAESKQILWGDFDADGDQARILHAMIAGQTGSGKDAILRLWFTTLTLNNTPEEVQFIILDGKIDWLSDALATSAYMAIPPAGGIELRKIDGKRVDQAKERMAQSLDWVFDEVERRSTLFREMGVVNLNAYNMKARKLGKDTLPMLFLIASDVGAAFNDDLEMLVQLLIMKGRAFGVRMIISMQNPVGESTAWRSQIGLVMSGFQQDPNHDRYIMGIGKERALIRPSQLPDPEDNDLAKGLFVVRRGSKQYLVRTAHLPETDWFNYIESNRFFKKWYNKAEQSNLLEEMLFGTPKLTKRLQPIAPQAIIQRSQEPSIKKPTDVLSHDQIKIIAHYAKLGWTKTAIMEKMGFMNAAVWDAKVAAVEYVILATRGYIKK